MCGIAGIRDRNSRGNILDHIERMIATLPHRGPDGSGTWVDDDAGVAFGHRRLAIIDLTEAGKQPMHSAGDRYVITYNGELYNTEELRTRLAQNGVTCRGLSDTEVLVNAIESWGLDKTLREINGIYAFAVWDRKSRALSLVRDRVGVKPLFWSYVNGALMFASELRALAALPEFDRTLDLAAIGSLLQYNYVRSPMTIYRAAQSLEPGMALTLPVDGAPTLHRYWSLASLVSEKAGERARTIDPWAAVEALEELLQDSVRRQLVSDVPVGVFLSGGIDSSTVVALMQKIADRPVRSFSIGFEHPELNEAEMAKSVAAAVKSDHTNLYVTEKDALDCVPQLARIYDQPHADLSAVPTYLLCKMAREYVTVALSGDGGDELFYGYDRFDKAARTRALLSKVPELVRRAGSFTLDLILPLNSRENAINCAGSLARYGWHASRILNFASRDVNDTYLHFITHWPEPDLIVRGAPRDIAHWEASKRAMSNFDELMMYHDTMTFMTDYVLAKVDRASMAASVEVRVPFLDHRVIELAWRFPFNLKKREGAMKWCLRQVLYKHVPRELVDRPKAGFQAPVGHWLRGPLRDWAESLLSERALSNWGLIDPAPVRRLWQAHVSGDVDAVSHLWSILLMQAWLEETKAPARTIEVTKAEPAAPDS